MPKVAFIGAGSVVFARNLSVDLLGFEALRDSTELVLMDIDGERLRTAERELAAQPEFAHVVINDRLEQATDELVGIVRRAMGA